MENSTDYRLIYPDFDLSMKRYGHSAFLFDKYFDETSKSPHYLLKEFFRKLYESDASKKTLSATKRLIPKKIHQIWLGGELPKIHDHCVNSWNTLPGWEYRLWTDSDLVEFDLELLNQTNKLVEKADILRWEILKKYGGIYVDVDVDCLNPQFFEFANNQYTFYIGLEPVDNYYFRPWNDFYLRCGTAVIASVPEHPLAITMLDELRKNIRLELWPIAKTGPDFVTSVINRNPDLISETDLIFPSTFFYPVAFSVKESHHVLKFCKLETACVHYFAISWEKEKD